MDLNEKEIVELREKIKVNLSNSFIEEYKKWKDTLNEVNWFIKDEIDNILILDEVDETLLYTYDEMCHMSLDSVDIIKIDKLDSVYISNLITDLTINEKILTILTFYINKNKILI